MSRHYKEHTKPNKFKKNREWGKSKIGKIFSWGLAAFILWPIAFGIRGNIERNTIRNKGVPTTGWIYNSGIGRKNNLLYYKYFVNGKKYLDHTAFFDDKKVGDTVKIYYYPPDPSINRDWKAYAEIIREK